MGISDASSVELRKEVEAASVLISKLEVYSLYDIHTPKERNFGPVFGLDPEPSDSDDSGDSGDSGDSAGTAVASQGEEYGWSILGKVIHKSKKLLPKLPKK
ncbi:unnamed protein product [Kluyveromyces dobzhanskii CBS 2104]|uniref:WGS project CCBQ000000000 data, contig 00102 n=1 Tax=Kluyveromyces dobzhanskii CBS 2104 TaxID=1427455 RepID=A0A0A8L6I2_9SACH|nr:unnamed protein product [Kluyveromyces dobzhanskii CBS 2104]